MSALVRRVSTGTGLVLGVALLLALDGHVSRGWVPLFCSALLAGAAGLELDRMKGYAGMGIRWSFGLAWALALGLTLRWIVAGDPRPDPPALFIQLALASGAGALLGALLGRRPAAAWGFGVAFSVWVIPTLFALVPFGVVYGTRGLVLLILLSKVGDVFGYLVGRKIGRRHPFPRLSPNKTLAGCVASTVAAVLVGAIAVPLLQPDAVALHGALLGLALNLVAQVGDLLESWVKRRADVKDSSPWLGPAGGVLDVIDSLLTTIPLGVFLWPALV